MKIPFLRRDPLEGLLVTGEEAAKLKANHQAYLVKQSRRRPKQQRDRRTFQFPEWAQPIKGADITTDARQNVRYRLIISQTPVMDEWPFTLHILIQNVARGSYTKVWREESWVPLRNVDLTDLRTAIEAALADSTSSQKTETRAS